MAKGSGGVRTFKRGTSTHAKRKAEVDAMHKSGRYSSVEMTAGGGYVAIEKSKAKHKPEEIEAARTLAKKGYKVILKDEAGELKTPDGYIFTASFEQRTPQGETANNIFRGLEHAKSKRADIAVLYDKFEKHSRKTIEQGIVDYETKNEYRFKQIIVISKNGNVHRHKHNK